MTFEQEFRATLEHIEESLTRLNLCVIAMRRLQERMQENRPDFDYTTGMPPKEESHG
jgi:hypothetical protein